MENRGGGQKAVDGKRKVEWGDVEGEKKEDSGQKTVNGR